MRLTRASLAASAVAGKIGVKGGGFWYSAGGYAAWDYDVISYAGHCPPPPRSVRCTARRTTMVACSR